MRIERRLTIGFFVGLAWWPSANAQHTIQTSKGEQEAVLGSAYQSDKQRFIGQACVQGTDSPTAGARSTFDFTQDISEKTLAKELGIEAGGRAQFGVVEASASANFAKRAASNEFSVSAIYFAEYQFPIQKLGEPNLGLTPTGKVVEKVDERWNITCGDEYVSEITKGAKLFFSVRADFSSKEEKQRFESRFSLSGPLVSVNAKLEEASQEFSRQIKITVSGLQIGGDVSQVTGMFGDSPSGLASFTECSLGKLEQCAAVTAAALNYATNREKGFPAQLKQGSLPGPSVLSYRTVPYSSIGRYSRNPPGLSAAIASARLELANKFEEQVKWRTIAERLVSSPWARSRVQGISEQKLRLDSNVEKILQASTICYDEPEKCPNSVRTTVMALTKFDTSVFDLPPVPALSVRLWSIERQVWPLLDSQMAMTGPEQKLGNQVMRSVYPEVCGRDASNVMETRKRQSKNFTSYLPARNFGTAASVILLIEGDALSTATLYFENVAIRSIPISHTGKSRSKWPDKVTQGSAFLVLTTTRLNAEWLDIDLEAEVAKLEAGGMTQADGSFFIVVSDDYGREQRAELALLRWNHSIKEWAGFPFIDDYSVDLKARWWNGSDTLKTTGSAPWTVLLSSQAVECGPGRAKKL